MTASSYTFNVHAPVDARGCDGDRTSFLSLTKLHHKAAPRTIKNNNRFQLAHSNYLIIRRWLHHFDYCHNLFITVYVCVCVCVCVCVVYCMSVFMRIKSLCSVWRWSVGMWGRCTAARGYLKISNSELESNLDSLCVHVSSELAEKCFSN